MNNPVDRIIDNIPANLFRNLLEQMDAAFSKAVKFTGEKFQPPEKTFMLGQARHAFCEEGFRAAAENVGLNAVSATTEPVGGRYSLIRHQGIHLIRGNIQVHCGPPRATRFRKEWALVNSWIDPLQLDLFSSVPEPSSDKLCAMLVVSADKKSGDSSLPAFVGLGIPHSDLSSWAFLEPLSKLLGRYNYAETNSHTQEVAEIGIKDLAIPRLKNRSRTD
ncbi:hypothetical protein A9Q96_00515 [Rhodobacterales bacterium 52_120_T64]|mgnify:CR=1 FL=1|nr:hypothetical protein A9Q96_00515 [Rhodobacterales bacterium 52_120_T64]